MGKNAEVKIHFKISGTELEAENGYDLYYLSQSMKLFHQLIEKSYLTLRAEKNMSRAKRSDMKIKVLNMREGSFEADFQLIVNQIMPSLLTMVTALDAKNVWELTKLSYEYLLIILKANSEGKSVNRTEVNNENTQLQIIDNHGKINVNYNFHPDVIENAKTSYPVFKRLGNLIDDKNETLQKMEFSDVNERGEGIQIGAKEKMLLQNRYVLNESPVKFRGKIFDANIYKCNGKLEILESENICLGEYNFEFIDKENADIKNFIGEESYFTALKLTSFNPNTLESSIKVLKIVNVK